MTSNLFHVKWRGNLFRWSKTITRNTRVAAAVLKPIPTPKTAEFLLMMWIFWLTRGSPLPQQETYLGLHLRPFLTSSNVLHPLLLPPTPPTTLCSKKIIRDPLCLPKRLPLAILISDNDFSFVIRKFLTALIICPRESVMLAWAWINSHT